MVYDKEGLERNRDYVECYRRVCRAYGIGVRAILDTELPKLLERGERPLLALVRTIQPTLNERLEKVGVPTFHNSRISRICNHKGSTLDYYRDKVLSIPCLSFHAGELCRFVDSSVSAVKQIFQQEFMYSTFEEYERPLVEKAGDFVIKAVAGHGGSQVFSLKWDRERIREGIGKDDFVLQPMVESKKGFQDLRVYIIGKEIQAAVLREVVEERGQGGGRSGKGGKHEFRANFSLGGRVSLYKLNQAQKEIVGKITGELDFGLAGIDFLFDDEGRLLLNEIEDVVGARMLYECEPGFDVAERYVKYLLQRIGGNR